jgi:hypothetical protein
MGCESSIDHSKGTEQTVTGVYRLSKTVHNIIFFFLRTLLKNIYPSSTSITEIIISLVSLSASCM